MSSKNYDKLDDFYFVNFPALDGYIPRYTSNKVYILVGSLTLILGIKD